MLKKSTQYELIAAISVTLGAVLLAYTYYPILNPLQFQIDNPGSGFIGRLVVGTPISLFILLFAWHFNLNARRLIGADAKTTEQAKTARYEDVMRILFTTSIVCAALSVIAVGALSVMTIDPSTETEVLRLRIELLGIGFAIGWGWLAVWARKRRGISQTVLVRTLGQALVILSVIYAIGIIAFFLG